MATTETQDRDLECVHGQYFDEETGKYVPLQDRKPTDSVERALEDLENVEDVVQIGFSYIHVQIIVDDRADQKTTIRRVKKALERVFRKSRVDVENIVSDNTRYHEANKLAVFRIR